MHNKCFKSSLKWRSGSSSYISIDCSSLTPHLDGMCRHTCRGCKELCCLFVFLKSDCLSDLCVIFICAAPPWITPIFSSVPGSATSFPGGRRGISHLFNILTLLIWEISLAFATFPHSDFSIFWPIIRDITATQIFIFYLLQVELIQSIGKKGIW